MVAAGTMVAATMLIPTARAVRHQVEAVAAGKIVAAGTMVVVGTMVAAGTLVVAETILAMVVVVGRQFRRPPSQKRAATKYMIAYGVEQH